MSAKKIAVIALNPHFERSWIDTGVFKEFSKFYKCDLFACLDNNMKVNNVNILNLFSEKEIKKYSIVKNLAAIAMREKSSSFNFVQKRIYWSDYYWIQKQFCLLERIKFFLKNVSRFLHYFVKINRISFFYFIPFKKLFFKFALTRLKPNHDIRNIFKNYDLVILHSCAMEIFTPIIIRSLAKTPVKSLMVMENWDNLTSKQIFLFKPDHIGVIGPIDRTNASSIHKIHSDNIHSLGLPKFEILKKIEYKPISKKLKTILYVGFSLPHDEISFLNKLQLKIYNKGNNFELTYRPHPAAKKRLINPTLDSRIKITSKNLKKKSNLYELNKDYFTDLLNADIVLGAPTTLMLEVMQLGIPVFIDITNDKIHRTTSAISSKNYLHARQFIEVFKDYTFSSLDELILLLNKSKNYQKINYVELSRFINLDNFSYAFRLKKIIDGI